MSDPVPSRRRERSGELCRILSDHVRQVARPGLGRWEPAWEIVEGPSRRFLEALEAWERTGDERQMDRAKALAIQVRDAWMEAGRKHRGSVEIGARKLETAL